MYFAIVELHECLYSTTNKRSQQLNITIDSWEWLLVNLDIEQGHHMN